MKRSMVQMMQALIKVLPRKRQDAILQEYNNCMEEGVDAETAAEHVLDAIPTAAELELVGAS